MSDNYLSRRRFVLAGAATTAGVAILHSIQKIAAAPTDAVSGPRTFTSVGRECRFDTGVLRGTLRGGGKSLGLQPVVDIASGKSLAAALGLLTPYPPYPVPWTLRPRLAAPLALRRDLESGLTAGLMAPVKDCFAMSTPCGEDHHRSLYLSLFGRDLKAGETASACARLVIGKNISDQQAIDLYETYRTEFK